MKDILRSRLTTSLDDLARSLLSSLKDDLEIVDEDILGTIAHDLMLHSRGIISNDEIKKIMKALLDIREDIKKNGLIINDSYEDIHPLVETRIIDKIGIDAGGKIHSGRSRNDQVAVDIRLKLRDFLIELRQHVIELINVIIDKAKKHIDTPFPLYTHLQPAQLGTFSHLLMSWAFELLRHASRLAECFKRTNMSPLGACAIGGTSFPIDRDQVARYLGFDGYIINSIDAISSRDVIIENAFNLAQIAIFFSRISEDLIIFSSSEFKFIELPDKFCSVSSVLPQKKNPDTLELIRSKAALMVATLTNELIIAKGTPSGYNRDFQDCKPPLWQSYPVMIACTRLLARIIEELSLHDENIIKSLEKSDLIALDLAEHICLKNNLAFRKSHELIARIVQYLNKNNKSLSSTWDSKELSDIKNIAKEVTGDKDIIDDEFTRVARDIHSYKIRKSAGSPSPESVQMMFQVAKQEMAGIKESLAVESKKIAVKINELLETAKNLAS